MKGVPSTTELQIRNINYIKDCKYIVYMCMLYSLISLFYLGIFGANMPKANSKKLLAAAACKSAGENHDTNYAQDDDLLPDSQHSSTGLYLTTLRIPFPF